MIMLPLLIYLMQLVTAREDLGGHKFIVGHTRCTPFMFDHEIVSDLGSKAIGYGGSDLKMLEYLARALNFRFK